MQTVQEPRGGETSTVKSCDQRTDEDSQLRRLNVWVVDCVDPLTVFVTCSYEMWLINPDTNPNPANSHTCDNILVIISIIISNQVLWANLVTHLSKTWAGGCLKY
jgi:hypothetical protein